MARFSPVSITAQAQLLVALTVSTSLQPLWAQGRVEPTPPPRQPTLYDPDPGTCQSDAIRSSFARHLQPFADQSPEVLQRLRQVQLQLTKATLQRCVSKGLMDAATAAKLRAELLKTPQSPDAAAAGAAQPSTRP